MDIGLGPHSVSSTILVCKKHEPSLPHLLLGCTSMIDTLGGVSFKASERPNQYVVTFGLHPSGHKRTIGNNDGLHSLFTSQTNQPDAEFERILKMIAPSISGLSRGAPPTPQPIDDFISHPVPGEDITDFDFTNLDFTDKRRSFASEFDVSQPRAPIKDDDEPSWSDESGLRQVLIQASRDDITSPVHNAAVMFDSDFRFNMISQDFLDEAFTGLPIVTTKDSGRISIRALGARGYQKKSVKLNRVVHLNISFGSVKWRLRFFVADGLLGSLVIGTDTPSKWSLQEWNNLNTCSLTIEGQTTHLISSPAESKYWRAGLDLISAENCLIQPHSVLYVQVRNPGAAASSSYGSVSPGVGLVSRRRFWNPKSGSSVYATSSAYYNEYPRQVIIFNPTESVCLIHSGMNIGDFTERSGTVLDSLSTSSSRNKTPNPDVELEPPPPPKTETGREAALKLLKECALSVSSAPAPYKNNNAQTPASRGESSLSQTRDASDEKEQARLTSRLGTSPERPRSSTFLRSKPHLKVGASTEASVYRTCLATLARSPSELGDDHSVNQESGTIIHGQLPNRPKACLTVAAQP